MLRDMSRVRKDMIMPAYYDELNHVCPLDKCMQHCRERFGRDEKSPVRDMDNGKVRAACVAMSMQDSCISNADVDSASVKLSEDGTCNLVIVAADMGAGCDNCFICFANLNPSLDFSLG